MVSMFPAIWLYPQGDLTLNVVIFLLYPQRNPINLELAMSKQ